MKVVPLVLLAVAVFASAAVAALEKPATVRSRAERVQFLRADFTQTGKGPAGPQYWVEMSIRLQVKAPAQKLRLKVTETMQRDREDRTFDIKHPGGLRVHTITWRLPAKYFGAGTYKVSAVIIDEHGQSTLSREKSFTTLD